MGRMLDLGARCLLAGLVAAGLAVPPSVLAEGAPGPATPAPVVLVIHTAQDCPVCAAWRASPEGLPVAERLPHEWPRLRVVFIERAKLYGGETEALYPADLAALYRDRRERYQLSPPVPLFEIVRGGQVIARQAGLSGWTEGTVPALLQLKAADASP